MIPFNRPYLLGSEQAYIAEAFENGWVSGGGPFTRRAEGVIEHDLAGVKKALLTTSCTHALEMSAILLDLEPGDEVIVPSFTFVTTALAFFMHGAKIVFADIKKDTKNINENQLSKLITKRTKAIVVVHYAGIACEMDAIMQIAEKHHIVVIEDNAHGMYGQYKGKFLGTIGHLATQSFHETKNITCGEGGALLINDEKYIERAEVIREKGTNRAKFYRGEVDKYSWIDRGSSYVISDILAAFLYAQLNKKDDIQSIRQSIWNAYNAGLSDWASANGVDLPVVPVTCVQAYHLFYLVMPSLCVRSSFIEYMKLRGVHTVFHYLPLHSSGMMLNLGHSVDECPVSTGISERLVRLPFYNGMTVNDLDKVIAVVKSFAVF